MNINSGIVEFNQNLQIIATLYKDEKAGKFLEKTVRAENNFKLREL